MTWRLTFQGRLRLENNTTRILGIAIVSIGILLGLALVALAVWGDLEASLFDSAIREEAQLTTLRCPVMITAAETGRVTAAFTNPAERPLTLIARASITRRYVTLMRQVELQATLAPGETRTLEWTVSAEDAAYRQLILVRVRSLRSPPLPSRDGACGIVVVNLPYLTGDQLVTLMVVVSTLSMGVGLWLVERRRANVFDLGALRAMSALAGLVVVGMVVSLLGWWVLGAAVIALALLLIVELLRHLAGR